MPSLWWLGPAIAALIAAGVTVLTHLVNSRRARNDRQRKLFSSALGDIVRYCEFPYIVRRRRHDIPEEERGRISAELSAVQRKLNHNREILQVEAPRVGQAFDALAKATRRAAGRAIHDGWNLEPTSTDCDMHVADIDLGEIEPYKVDYRTAVADHLAVTPWWFRATVRSLGHWMSRVLQLPLKTPPTLKQQASPLQDDEPQAA